MSFLEPPMILQLTGYNIGFSIELPVKYYLKKINITSSDSCTFCNENSETIQHVLLIVRPLWNALSTRVYENALKELGLIVVMSFLVNTL